MHVLRACFFAVTVDGLTFLVLQHKHNLCDGITAQHTAYMSTTTQKADDVSKKKPKQDIFNYGYLQPHLLVRTVEMHVNLLSSENDNKPRESNASEAGESLNSDIEPFRFPLPIPPNCKLYRQLAKNKHVTKMNGPICYTVTTGGSDNSMGEKELVFADDIKVRTGLKDNAAAVAAAAAATKRQQQSKAETEEAPFNSDNLMFSSLGYVYEDAWNLDETRPLIANGITFFIF